MRGFSRDESGSQVENTMFETENEMRTVSHKPDLDTNVTDSSLLPVFKCVKFESEQQKSSQSFADTLI